MACTVFDEDIALSGFPEGTYTVKAELSGRANAAANELAFTVTRPLHGEPLGPVTVLGLDARARGLLVRGGATLHDYTEGELIDREVILVGGAFNGRAAAWRALYARCAQGAHVVFLAPSVFLIDARKKSETPRWLAVDKKGIEALDKDWLYHKDVVAKSGPAFARLQTRLMTPEYYEGILENTPFFEGITPPDAAEAVAIRCSGIVDSAGAFSPGTFVYKDGVMLGTYRHHAGHFTVNALNILGNIGNPAADRLLLNLVAEAESDAASVHPLPEGYASEIAALGIVDTP